MATREENLKKLNAELEKLSDEELEQIAGGYNRIYDAPSNFEANRIAANSQGGLEEYPKYGRPLRS